MLLVSLLLAGCGAKPSASVSGSKRVDSYVSLGGRIKTCWFNRMAPLLPAHVYRADVSPDGSQVKINIHERRSLGRAGRVAYIVDFQQEGPPTVVATQVTLVPAPPVAALAMAICALSCAVVGAVTPLKLMPVAYTCHARSPDHMAVAFN